MARNQKQNKAEAVDTSSGGLNSYYLARVEYPQRKEQRPYTAECEDIIDALQLTWEEANILKEIWRTAKGRQGQGKSVNTKKRAADKIVHYALRNSIKINRGQ